MPPEIAPAAPVSPAPVAPPAAPVAPPNPAPAPVAGGNNPAPAAPAADPNAPKGELWGDKWREAYAGEDKAKLNVLTRYQSPKDVLDSLFASKGKVDELMKGRAPGKDATPEQVTAFRKENGIPEKADGYFDALPKGVVFGEADKPVIMGYLEAAHARNTPPEQVAETLGIYHQAQEQAVQAMQERDLDTQMKTEDLLRREWGGEYRSNMEKAVNFIAATFPKELHEPLMNARMGDEAATPLMLNPAYLKAMVTLARQLNPTGTQTPGGGMDSIDAIEDQINTYKKKMGTREWYKDTAAQKHYQELVAARDRIKVQK